MVRVKVRMELRTLVVALLVLCVKDAPCQESTKTISTASGYPEIRTTDAGRDAFTTAEISSTPSVNLQSRTTESVLPNVGDISSAAQISSTSSDYLEYAVFKSESTTAEDLDSYQGATGSSSTVSEVSHYSQSSTFVPGDISPAAQISSTSSDYIEYKVLQSEPTTTEDLDSYQGATGSSSTVSEVSNYSQSSTFVPGDISSMAQISSTSSEYIQYKVSDSTTSEDLDSYQGTTGSSSAVSEVSDYSQSSTFESVPATTEQSAFSTTTDLCNVTNLLLSMSVSNITSRSFLVQWKKLNCRPSKIIKQYILRIERIETVGYGNCQREKNDFRFTLLPNETTFLFTNGYPYRRYLVVVQAETIAGVEESVNLNVDMRGSVPGAPLNLTISDVTAVSFVAKWEEPMCSFGEIKEYVAKIKYSESAMNEKCYHGDENYEFVIKTHDNTINFTHAQPYSTYKVSVSAETAAGVGESVETMATTAENVPDVPRNLTISNVTTSSFSVTWESPLCGYGAINNYIVTIEYLGHCSKEVPKFPYITKTGETHFTFDSALPDTSYKVFVAAETAKGKGTSAEKLILTEKDVPEAPISLKVDKITSNSFFVSWEVSQCSSSASKYKLVIKYLGPVDDDTQNMCRPASIFVHQYFIFHPVMEFHFNSGSPLSKYEVIVTALNGELESSRTSQEVSTIASEPEAPKDLNVNSSDAIISWSPPQCVPGFIYYILNITLLSPQQECVELNEYYHVNDTSFKFQNAVGNSEYEVSVAAHTKYGDGKIASTHVTIIPTVLSQVRNLRVPPINSSSALAEWDNPCPMSDVISNFTVTVGLQKSLYGNGDETCTVPEEKCYIVNDTRLVVNNLQANLIYNLTVAANGKETGRGDIENKLFKQPPRAPSEVRNLNVTSINPTSATASWNPPCFPSDDIMNYRVLIGIPRNGTEIEGKVCDTAIFDNGNETVSNNTYITMNNLEADCQYNLSVTAVGKETGNGDPKYVLFQQPPGVPELNTSCVNCLMADPFKTENPTKEVMVALEANLFSTVNGKVLYYAILVNENDSGMESESNFLKGALSTDCTQESWKITGLNTYDEWKSNKTVPYQATPICWKAFPENITFAQFCLGNGSHFGSSVFNAPLKAGTRYSVKVRAFTSHGYQDSDVIHIQTDTETSLALTMGLVIGFIVAGIIGVIIVMQRNGQLPRLIRSLAGRNTPQHVHPRAVALKRFPEYCSYLLDIPGRLSSEFQLLASLSVDIKNMNSFNAGLLPDNKFKNRYVNIIPYDVNRVKLDIEGDDLSSDYINASFVNGYSQKLEYIACQGPKEDTIYDFWRMVYQCGVKIIVMVTQLEEQGKVKCCQYYPNLWETMTFNEDISVRCTTELCFPIYTSRTLILQKGGKKRMIVHLHFREWPDFGCPATTEVMLLFCQTVRYQVMLSSPGLVVVHCSAGVGRTGTLIAVDMLLQHIRENKNVDIFGVVYELRKQRVNMVQTEGQYAYIYRCIKDALLQPSYLKQEKVVKGPAEPIYENIAPKFTSPKVKANALVNECEL